MSGDAVRISLAVALLFVLILLRLQADTFAAAEFDEPGNRYHRGWWTRLAWYGLGLLGLGALYTAHPQARYVLYLVAGQHVDVFLYGLPLAAIGMAAIAGFAWYRYGTFRLPPLRAYPGAALNSVFTALIDEATFRGAVQGFLLAIGFPDGGAILTQAIVYVLATRSAAPGRHRFMLLLSAGLGLSGGWVTYRTGGIGAAILAHSLISFALFVFTGHAGQVARPGEEPEEREAVRQASGWRDVRTLESSSGDDGSNGSQAG